MSEQQQVFTNDGRRGVIIGQADPTRDDPRFVQVAMDDGPVLHVPAELLELRPDGAFNLNIGAADVALAGNANPGTARAVGAEERIVLPVVAEELRIDKRTLTAGVVRVHKRVHEHEELVDENITREEVHVERVPVGQLVSQAPSMRNEGETLVIPVLEEVLVVERRLRLKEEVRITWQRTVERAPQRVSLRSEEVVIERDTAADSATVRPENDGRPNVPGAQDRP